MKFHQIFGIALALLCALVLIGCNRSGSTVTVTGSPPIPSLEYTIAVQTVNAELTRAAVTQAAETQLAGGPKDPGATATPLPPTLAPTPQSAATTAPVEPPPAATVTPTTTSATEAPATPEPATATSIPQPTFPPTDVRASLGAPTWVDQFDGSADWYKYEDKRVRFQAKDDVLLMTAFETTFEIGWALAPVEMADKLYLEMTVTTKTCKGLDRYGLMISPNNQANQGYMFDFSCDGRYSLWIWDGSAASSLVPWTASSLIHSGANQTNRIGVKIDGEKISLYANGSLLTEVTNKRLAKAYFGVFVGASETDDYTVAVSEMNYWELK